MDKEKYYRAVEIDKKIEKIEVLKMRFDRCTFRKVTFCGNVPEGVPGHSDAVEHTFVEDELAVMVRIAKEQFVLMIKNLREEFDAL